MHATGLENRIMNHGRHSERHTRRGAKSEIYQIPEI
jgi:hypothetical protein